MGEKMKSAISFSREYHHSPVVKLIVTPQTVLKREEELFCDR